MLRLLAMYLCFVVSIAAYAELPVNFSKGDLRVSENNRYLVYDDGSPFFYLGDTAWELFHRLTLEESEAYLQNRSDKQFTVIQAVVLAELEGLTDPNANGDLPLIDQDPTKPNEAYFEHVDRVVKFAEEKGLIIGMLPTWGDKFVTLWGVGPVIFTEEDHAEVYGEFLGKRYKDSPNIIWILGGDRFPHGKDDIWRAMARGIQRGDGGRHLMTYHPQGGDSSAKWFHNDKWLDFNMFQSGHFAYDVRNDLPVDKDYVRTPVKPIMDGEPRYENHPVNWDPANGWFNDFDVRQAAYWSVIAGGFGVTYGCHDIWQMMDEGREPISKARNYWHEVLDLPGAFDMAHLRSLMESRPFLDRVPDQSIIADGTSEGAGAMRATRGNDYAFVYTPLGEAFTVNLGKVSGNLVRAWWFDPREGTARKTGVYENTGTRSFDPPGEPGRGNDWVLVLDDASKEFTAPGE